MKAKLVKTENGYGLEDVEIIAFYSSKRPEHKHYKLSKQNCDSLFEVVDVEQLTKDFYETRKFESSHIADPVSFKIGFNKAMDLNKDKVFTREDMINFAEYCKGDLMKTKDLFNEYQSLQQPTEIDVEIEMETKNKGFTPSRAVEEIQVPKLDSEGCLILKKL